MICRVSFTGNKHNHVFKQFGSGTSAIAGRSRRRRAAMLLMAVPAFL
jgi:hypothetical protein